MPSPNKGEKQDEFISRCMGDSEANKTFPDQKQRAAFCYAQWKKHEGKASAAEMQLAEVGAQCIKVMRDWSAAVEQDGAALKNVEIFAVGEWRGSKAIKVTGEMLDQILANFEELNSKVSGFGVPLKIGHKDEQGMPAMGWMSALRREGDKLVADFTDVDPAIVDAIAKRRYNSVSVEIYPRVSYGGKTYENVLGGVAALGAEWPAVKGLKPLSASLFAGQGEKLELFKEIATVTTTFTAEQHEAILASAVAKAKADVTAELQGKVTAAENRATLAETALKTMREEAENKEIADIIAAAEKDGRVVPGNKAKFVAMGETLRKATYSDAKGRADAIAGFKALVEALPKTVTFGERGRSEADGAAAAGQKVADQIDTEAKALMAQDSKLTYAEAVTKVFALKPDLKTAYAKEM